RSERAWARAQTPTLADYQRAGVGGAGWQRGTRWAGGLSGDEIAAIEQRHGIRFPPDLRLFLEMLHATTPRRIGAAFAGDALVPIERAGFYDWRSEEADIRA